MHGRYVFKSLEAIKQLNSLIVRAFVMGVQTCFPDLLKFKLIESLVLGELLILVYFKYVRIDAWKAAKIE